ncbi:hypothetical protein [Arthrobacter zhaoguopingii]|uniref:hypothetical protein n=1 Tax=Arthrobacter zhaoguopingii TaxID=2681491 RepID=UPI00135932B6|nr:hypothetical protein [Arthrobacter zhaoguopingii]
MSGHLIQWAALLLCVLGALLRLPGVRRGRGRMIFAALVLMAIAVALSLPPIYLPVDGALGGWNAANLVIRLSLYAVVVLLGLRMAAAFDAERVRSLIVGPVGISVLLFTVAATLVLFALSDLSESSTGLARYHGQQTVERYADIGRLYPGYVSACLVVPAAAGALRPGSRPAHRLACSLLAAGFFLVAGFAVLELFQGLDLGVFEVVLPFGAILLVVSGLTLIWFSRSRGRPRQRNPLA